MTEPNDDAAAAIAGKRAVHVKWQGKTIALGTFPCTVADEKCAKAKALTRAWRSSMRPKPTRDWVINELERLGIRVVSGGRRRRSSSADEQYAPGSHPSMMLTGMNAATNSQMSGQAGQQQVNAMQNAWNQQDSQNSLKQARRNSSLGLSLLSNDFGKNSSFNSKQPSMNDSANSDLVGKPAFRELVGGGAAAAYNAYRDDFYRQQPSENVNGSGGSGDINNGKAIPSMPIMNPASATNPNEHYQMLKLHHMNLLNEIQETTLMMNIYQQQHLQQQQLLIQQQQNMASLHDGGNQMSMLLSLQQNGGGIANLQQQNGINLGQTHLIPSENHNDSIPQQRQAEGSQFDREKRRVEEASNVNGTKRQKVEGHGVETYDV